MRVLGLGGLFFRACEPDRLKAALGRLARIHHPEGDAVELWEPPSSE